jgi:NAD(P)-dependent dehydrogenase (short-subunit alcohol dehydrogenase family)
MDQFKGKIAIVTGGASGIGRALCDELGKIGAIVTVADLNAEGAKEVAKNINDNGGQARAEQLNVAAADEVRTVIEETCSDHGRLDFIFNNAGVLIVGETFDMSIEDWDRILDVNLKGVTYGTAIAYPIMVKQGFGHIVNMASYQGLIPAGAATAYVTTKHGVVGLSTSLLSEAVQFGVKVSVVCPGFINTAIFERADVKKAKPEDVVSGIPFKLMEANDAARVILKGVARNQKIIIFPFYARLFWYLYRIHPFLASPLVGGLIKQFRALKSET